MENKLPPNWKLKKIKDVCKVVSGATPKTSKPEYWGGDILWITPKDLSKFKGTIISDTQRRITKEGYDSCSATLVPKGTVLMSSRAPIGYLAIAGKEICTNQGFKSFICSDEINNKFLYYYLKGIVPELEQKGSGTTFNELSKTKAEEIEIPIPPLSVQEALVKKLDAFFKEYDILSEEKQKAKENHEKILQSAVMKVFFPEKFDDGWKLLNLDEVADIVMGQSPPSSSYNLNKDGLPFFQGKKEFGDMYPAVIKYCSEPKKTAEKNDTLLSVRAPVGPVNMAKEKSCIGRGLAAIRSKGDLNSEFIYYFMKGNEYNIARSGRGSTFDAISGKDIKKIKIPVPPNKEIQKEILTKLRLIMNFQESILDERKTVNKNIESLPHSVLTKAFQGELLA